MFISENRLLLALCLIGSFWGWSGVLLGAVLGYLIPKGTHCEQKRTEKKYKYSKRNRNAYEGVNPATGLPMSGGLDVAGNPYGCGLNNNYYDGSANTATGLSMGGGEAGVDFAGNPYGSGINYYDDCVNPATGLPMVGGEAGVDVEGNPYGSDSSGI